MHVIHVYETAARRWMSNICVYLLFFAHLQFMGHNLQHQPEWMFDRVARKIAVENKLSQNIATQCISKIDGKSPNGTTQHIGAVCRMLHVHDFHNKSMASHSTAAEKNEKSRKDSVANRKKIRATRAQIRMKSDDQKVCSECDLFFFCFSVVYSHKSQAIRFVEKKEKYGNIAWTEIDSWSLARTQTEEISTTTTTHFFANSNMRMHCVDWRVKEHKCKRFIDAILN